LSIKENNKKIYYPFRSLTMKRTILISITLLFFSGCSFMNRTTNQPPPTIKNKVVESVGYSAISSYKNYPKSQQILMAVRGAKMDAYRNLAEEIHGVRIKGNTTVKDMITENDSYRAYVDAIVRGAHFTAVTPKANGVYEAEVILTLTPQINSCLFSTWGFLRTGSCINSSAISYQSGTNVVPSAVDSNGPYYGNGPYPYYGYGSNPYYGYGSNPYYGYGSNPYYGYGSYPYYANGSYPYW